MMMKKKTVKVKKPNKTGRGKGGFTLVELSVVLALLAILTAMTVSFSVLMSGYAGESRSEYEFSEDCYTARETICTWLSENDVPDAVFTVSQDGSLTVTKAGSESAISLAGGILSFGDTQKNGLDAIGGITFSAKDNLIKCTFYRTNSKGEISESNYVFSPRCGAVTGGDSE